MKREILYGLLIFFLTISCSENKKEKSTILPNTLRCEYQLNPLGIDIHKPMLSWTCKTNSKGVYGQRQTAYQILVASKIKNLKENKGDIWDSGKIVSCESRVIYNGKPLDKLTKYFWKVRIWDSQNKMSEWSPIAWWETGMLSENDWQGEWIGRDRTRKFFNENINGYCSLGETSAEKLKWVQIDLREPVNFNEIIIHPAFPINYPDGQQTIANAGFGFPLRFRVDISDDSDFKKFTSLLDKTKEDFPNPGQKVIIINCPGSRARFIRFTASKLWNSRRGKSPYYFSLGELQVLKDGKDLSYGKPVKASDSDEGYGWSLKNLTDSVNLVSEEERGHESLLLRKVAIIPKKISSARAYICGLGYYELYINGKKIGNHLLDPGFTAYNKRALYVTYDVTKFLKKGKNCIGVILGSGWFDAATRDAWGFHLAPWISPPKVIINIVINYSDNTKSVIKSDNSWRLTEGPIIFNSIRSGEIYDARQEKDGWNLPGYDDSKWRQVTVVDPPGGKLVSQLIPPIQATDLITPVSLTEPIKGVYVFDMGVNMSGWVNFKIKGNYGDTIVLFYNEQLNPDGTVLYGPHAWWTYGKFQTDRYICSGKVYEFFEPKFTYHGFRYVQVTGLKKKPTLKDMKGVWVHTNPKRVGEFSCSNQKINKLMDVIIRTQLCNIHSIPTDCPHREKIGWMGDGLVTMEEAMWNFDMANFYIKWFNDMLDAREEDGHIPPIVPNPGWLEATSMKNNGKVPSFSDPWWGGAIIIIPWNIYRFYGDKRCIEQGFDAMKTYLDWIESRSKDHIVWANLGDWIEPAVFTGEKQTPRDQVGTAEYYFLTKMVSKMATLLNKPDDQKKYGALAKAILAKYNETFFNEETGVYSEDSQTAHVLPLAFGMVPPGKEKLVEKNLIDIIKKKNNHLSTGFVGTPLMFRLLSDIGCGELAYTMATQEDSPGWFYMLNNGATTIWEVWDALKQVNHSRNHPAFGSIAAWYYNSVAGIRPDTAGPGFSKFIIRPDVAGDLTWVKASYNSINGKITSDWELKENELSLKVTIPVNTTAKIYVPADSKESIYIENMQVDKSEHLKFIGNENRRYIFEAGSGIYNFRSIYHKI